MDPVDPKIAIFFIVHLLQHMKRQEINDWCSNNHAVEPVENSSMTGNQLSVILDIIITLYG